jgi:hypothetical protein
MLDNDGKASRINQVVIRSKQDLVIDCTILEVLVRNVSNLEE